MTKSLVFIAAASLLACKPGPESSPSTPGATHAVKASVTGSYRFAPNPADSIAGCRLKALQAPADSVRFQLNCNRGGPSYSSGFAEGTLHLSGDSAIWQTQQYGGTCVLQFAFAASTLELRQSGTSADCGFGNGVIAAGRFQRIDTLPPSFEHP